MCGIVGYTGLEDGAGLARMNALQVHRGPDDAGEFWDPEARVGLAMQRLSIVDLEGGQQPMLNATQDVVVSFNGEIFNAPDLRRDLCKQGVAFVSDHSDTEVVLRLYERVGEECAALLNGMFAFVIYDKRRRLLYGARDPFGIKPLHLCEHAEGLAWASEIKSFAALSFFDGAIDELAAEQYLGLQYIPGARTIYAGVGRLEPGTLFTYKLDSRTLERKRYYELPLGKGDATVPETEQVREAFADAVTRWNMADVPVACALSGGIDSAAIVACLARSGVPVKTYTVGFQCPADAGMDERAAAREVADMYDTDHHEILLDWDDLLADIPRMVQHLDEPYGGGLPSWFVFQYMAKDVKVAMTGTGGDELFSNYGKFRWLEERPGFRAALSLQSGATGLSGTLAWLSSRLTQAKALTWPKEEEGSIRDRHRREDAALFWTHPFGITFPTAHGSGLNERLGVRPAQSLSAGRSALEALFRASEHLSLRDRCAAVDLQAQLPDEFLLMTDRFSMAHSIEARTPFLDKTFAQFALSIPPEHRLQPTRPKQLLKNAFRDWLPAGYTERKKWGFVLPVARWLRGPLREEAMALFDPSALRDAGIIRPDFRDVFYSRFLEGHADLAETIWTVFMFRQWQQRGVCGG